MLRNSRFVFYSIIFTCAFCVNVIAQLKSNLEISEELVNKSINDLQIEIDVEELRFKSNLSGDFKILENIFMNSVKKKYSFAVFVNDNFHFSYSVSEITVRYENSFQENLFGEYFCERKITLLGSWFDSESNQPLKNFSFALTDTISIESIDEVENQSITFTKGENPDTPIWSSIYEPVIIVGAAATAVYLFFTVRSK